MKKSLGFVLMLLLSLSLAHCAMAASALISGGGKDNQSQSRPRLPDYENPVEIDILEGQLHISFKGAFRTLDEKKQPGEYIVFCFVVTPQTDMKIEINQSELFDSKGTRFDDGNRRPVIGRESTWDREIIAGIPMPVRFAYNMPVSSSKPYPFIARVNFRFNGQWFQFRNIQVEEWENWKAIQEALDL